MRTPLTYDLLFVMQHLNLYVFTELTDLEQSMYVIKLTNIYSMPQAAARPILTDCRTEHISLEIIRRYGKFLISITYD